MIAAMAAPENTAPPRPSSVPADARWDHAQAGFEWSTGIVDGEGRRHGRYCSWTRTGHLHGECDYDHGRVHGKNVTYHPDGTIASEADWQHGVIMDSVFHRCAVATPEPFAQASPGVWSVRYCTRDGKTNYTIRYFAKSGDECGPDGKPLPARAAGVSPDARWFADADQGTGRWVEGAIERGTNAQVGRWRWWSASGVLRHEELRDGRGGAKRIEHYTADGVLEQRIARDDDGAEQRDYFFDDGALSARYRKDARGRETYRASWLPDGTLDDERAYAYDGDVLASVIERTTGGALAFDARREPGGGTLSCVLFGPSGALPAASGSIADDRLVGRWKIFDPDGRLRRELDTTPLAIAQPPTGEGLAWRLAEALMRRDAESAPLPAELAGLRDAPWPGDVPACITALVATDPLVREYAHAAVESALEDPALAARALPYLAKLLANAAVDRTRLLATVYEICARAAGHDAIEAALGAAWPAIFSAFGRATYAERHQILAIAKLAPVAKADLLALARKDPDPAVRAFALDRLTELPTFTADDAQPSLTDRDNLVRAAAAIAVGQRQGPASTKDVVRVLDEALRTWRELARRFAELPYVDAHVLVATAEAAAAIGTPDARSLARELCAHLDDVEPRGALAYGNALLQLALGTGARPYAKRFVEILDTLAKSKPFWVHEHEAASLLAARGLPDRRLALSALVAELRASPDAEAALHARLKPQSS
jgi:hypothetical protein